MSSSEGAGFSPLDFLTRFYASSIGKKVIMAITGIVMWGFVIGHMAGNLQVFIPAAEGMPIDSYWGESLNKYAHTLKTTPPLLWGTRITLLVAVFVHIFTGISLAGQNRAARPVRYAGATEHRNATLWSKLMPFTGIIVMLFIIFHIAHYTLGVVDPSTFASQLTDEGGLHDVYSMVLHGFGNPAFVAIYVVGNALLVAHLVHGSQSVWQSFGIHHRSWTPLMKWAGWALVAALLAGNLAMPLVVFSWRQQGSNPPSAPVDVADTPKNDAPNNGEG